MIDDHFARALARGEVVSTLFAAETAIYQRFGYGLAAPAFAMSAVEPSTSARFRVLTTCALSSRMPTSTSTPSIIRDVLARCIRPGTMRPSPTL